MDAEIEVVNCDGSGEAWSQKLPTFLCDRPCFSCAGGLLGTSQYVSGFVLLVE